MRIDALEAADLRPAHALSTQAGWNQTHADWRRLIEHPGVEDFAGRVDGELVATATVATYDRLGGDSVGWIGMVLVEESHRRQGYGTRMLTRAMDWADGRLALVGLDATEYGRPLYRDRGFEDVAPIDRWVGPLSTAGYDEPSGGDVTVDRLAADELAPVISFDRAVCGVDRSTLLERLLDEDGVVGFVVRRDGTVTGYAVLRPGREHEHLGPVIAGDAAVAESLLDAAAHELDGRSVLVDAPSGSEHDLSSRDMSVQRELTRMTHPRAEELLFADEVFAVTSFEWG